jgi:hypothetical protein
MKKIYTVLTSLIILILVIHTVYMTLAVMHLIEPNEDFARNLGYILTFAAILHGIYGLTKWINTLYYQRKLMHYSKHTAPCHEVKMTMYQRVLGIVILVVIIPHGFIKVLSADAFPLIADICYILAILVHLWIGFPKWIVSMGLRPAKTNMILNIADGGSRKWK